MWRSQCVWEADLGFLIFTARKMRTGNVTYLLGLVTWKSHRSCGGRGASVHLSAECTSWIAVFGYCNFQYRVAFQKETQIQAADSFLRVGWKSQVEQVSQWNVLLPLRSIFPASHDLCLAMLTSLPDCFVNWLNTVTWQKTVQLFLLC